jgi:hypothetical protein
MAASEPRIVSADSGKRKALSPVTAVEQRQCYYRNRDVRARMREFIGATTVDDASCEFLAASDEQFLLS